MVSQSDLKVGSTLPFASVTTVTGRTVSFKRTTGPRFVHLCIGRFSGCPMCNLNYRAYSRKLVEVEKADCEFVVVLHTNKELIQENQGTAEWSKGMHWVADPKFETYKALGVGHQPLWKALLNWHVWVP